MVTDQRPIALRIVAVRRPYAVFSGGHWRPGVNVYETEAGYQIIAELAGVSLNELHVHVYPTQVAIHGSRLLALPSNLQRIQRMEINAGPFEVELPLDRPIDPQASTARYHNGLLDIWLPFAPQAQQRVVVINVQSGGAQ